MKILDRIDQIARRARTFQEAQQQIVTLLREKLPHYSWIGLYWVEGDELVLGGWDGPAPTEHTRIPLGRGICGAAATSGETHIVDDVSADPRYLQCFLHTKAEIVVPIFHGGRVIGEIDVDSDRPAAFNDTDRAFLESVAAMLAGRWARDVHLPGAGDATRAIADPHPSERGVHVLSTPIHSSSTFAFEDVESMEDYLQHQERAYVYTRYGNPTIRAAEQAVAAVEKAEDSALFASGMAAIASTLLSLVKAGEEIIVPHSVYGGTYHLCQDLLPRWGIQVRFVEVDDLLSQVPAANTRVVYFEPITNPLLRVVDVEAVVKRFPGVRIVVDNTIATPVYLRPLEKGVDLVIHSVTKYLGGHSDLIGGVVSGPHALVDRVRVDGRYLGTNFNPRDAFLLNRGVKTLPLRVRQQADTALRLARWLQGRAEVATVHHPLLESHPDHALASRTVQGCGLVTLELHGGRASAVSLLDRLTLWRRAASLGGVESLVSMPVLASHWNVPEEGLAKAGISHGTVRLSVGVEDFEDLRADLEQALASIKLPARV